MAIVAIECEGRGTWGILVDTVHERPVAVRLFECVADAEGFLAWSRANGLDVADLVRIRATNALEALVENWRRERCEACYTTTCGCVDCGRPCTQKCDHDHVVVL